MKRNFRELREELKRRLQHEQANPEYVRFEDTPEPDWEVADPEEYL